MGGGGLPCKTICVGAPLLGAHGVHYEKLEKIDTAYNGIIFIIEFSQEPQLWMQCQINVWWTFLNLGKVVRDMTSVPIRIHN